MADWENVHVFGVQLGEFVDYFWSLPLYGQILTVIGLAVLFALIGVGIYYLVKGIVYLIYYVLKGVAYLLYYIFYGIAMLFYGIALVFYKFFEWLYFSLSGKEKPVKNKVQESPESTPAKQTAHPEPLQKYPGEPTLPEQEFEFGKFCSACGMKFSSRMFDALHEKGCAFCEQCGKGFKSEIVEISS